MKNLHGLQSNPDNFRLSARQERIDDLEEEILSRENSNTDASELIQKLLVKVCSQPNLVVKPVTYIENLADKLTQQQKLTPFVCQELMVFYSKFTTNRQKADIYYENMISQMKTANDANFRPKNILNYIELLIKNRIHISKLIDVFRKLKQLNNNNNTISEDNNKSLSRFENRFLQIVEKHIFDKTNSTRLQELIETVFETGLASRRHPLTSIVIAKHILNDNLDLAFDYYCSNLSLYRTSLLEVSLLAAFLRKYDTKNYNKILLKEKKAKTRQIYDTIYRNFDQHVADNIFFLANVLNGNLAKANNIFEKNLGSSFDLDVLKRVCLQYKSLPMLNNDARHLSTNILEFISRYYTGKDYKVKELEEIVKRVVI